MRRGRSRGRGRGRLRESSPSTSSDPSYAPALHGTGRSRSPASEGLGLTAANPKGASSPLAAAEGPATAAAEAVGHPDGREQEGGGGLQTCQPAKRRRLDSGGQSGRAGSLQYCVVPCSRAPGSSQALSGPDSAGAAGGEALKLKRVLLAQVNLPSSCTPSLSCVSVGGSPESTHHA